MINPEIRKLGIGGSDVGAIFGVDRERDAFSVWTAKRGDLPRSAPNDRMLIGSALEPGVLKLYTHVTGREIRYVNETSRSADRPWMVYTPDALCTNEKRGVDAKVVHWDQRKYWGATSDDIPEGIQLQCWWYMAALDYDVWDVAALVGDGMPRVYPIIRDLEAERVMLAKVEEFWRRFIIGNEQPPIGGSESASIWLQQAFPHHKRPDLRPATSDELEMLADYAAVRQMQSSLDESRAELENKIKLAIADREGLIWSSGKFTWRKTKDVTKVHWESVARGLLHEYVKDDDTRAALLAMHTTSKPGPRRIWFDSDWRLALSKTAGRSYASPSRTERNPMNPQSTNEPPAPEIPPASSATGGTPPQPPSLPVAPAPPLPGDPERRLTVQQLALLPDSERRTNWINSLVESEVARLHYAYDQAQARNFALSGKFDDIKGSTPEQSIATAMVKIQMGRAWGFNAADSIRYIYFVGGRPALEMDIVAGKLIASGIGWDTEFTYEEVPPKDKSKQAWQKCTGCTLWLKVFDFDAKRYSPMLKRDGVTQVSVSFTLADAENAMYWEKNEFKPLAEKFNYKSYPSDMYYWRCISRVRKYYAPNVLRGGLIREEALELQPDPSGTYALPSTPETAELPAVDEIVRPKLRDRVIGTESLFDPEA